MEEKERKEKSRAEEREKNLKQLNEYGSLCEDAEVEIKVAAFSTKKDKKSAVKVQLCFRQKVIESKCHRSYFTMASGGKMKPMQYLLVILSSCFAGAQVNHLLKLKVIILNPL